MPDACPVMTPTERRYCEILGAIEDELTRKIGAAIAVAAERAGSELAAAGLDGPAPVVEYYASLVHQHMYCVMCGADPETFAGGRAETAITVIRNSQNIAKHYWGAQIEPYPKA